MTLRRTIANAPWQAAAPLALVAIAVLSTALLVADAGGWSQVMSARQGYWTTYGPISESTLTSDLGALDTLIDTLTAWLATSGGMVFVLLGAALVATALAGWRWITVPILVALCGTLAGWVNSGHLDYLTVVFREAASETDMAGQVETSITMYGAVALLLVFGLAIALVWAVTGTLARRRRTDDEPGPPRRPPRKSLAIGALAVVTALVAPRAGNTLAHAARDLFDVTRESFMGGEQTMWLLFTAIFLTYLGALMLPRRAPATAVALVLVGAALWIPTIWMFGGMLPLDAIDEVISGTGALVMWAVGFAGAVAISAWTLARSARTAPPALALDRDAEFAAVARAALLVDEDGLELVAAGRERLAGESAGEHQLRRAGGDRRR